MMRYCFLVIRYLKNCRQNVDFLEEAGKDEKKEAERKAAEKKKAEAEKARELLENGEIRRVVEELYGTEAAQALRIQYGGSVKPGNIVELLAKEHIDGALVGGASLQPESYLKLLEAAANA